MTLRGLFEDTEKYIDTWYTVSPREIFGRMARIYGSTQLKRSPVFQAAMCM